MARLGKRPSSDHSVKPDKEILPMNLINPGLFDRFALTNESDERDPDRDEQIELERADMDRDREIDRED